MRLKKLRVIISLILFISFLLPQSIVFASNAYYINGVYVHYDDYASSPDECWVYANNIYKKIWGKNFNNQFTDSDNMLRNLSDSELTLTPEHLKMYVSNAALGSCLRICNSQYLHGTDGWGHSQIIVQKDSNGFTVFQGGLSASPYRNEKYYTWNEYCNTSWLGGSYDYIKYIKWPGAGAYSSDAVPIGSLDGVTGGENSITVRGWAYDPDSPSAAISVDIYVDDVFVASLVADQSRPDVGNLYGCGDNHGFSAKIEYNVGSTGTHEVKAYGINTNSAGRNSQLTQSPLTVTVTTNPIGSLDGATGGEDSITVRGWAYDPDFPSATLTVDIYVDDVYVGNCVADKSRPDVGNLYGCGDNHGFSGIFEYEVDSAGSHEVKAYPRKADSSKSNTQLTHSPLTVTVTTHSHVYSSVVTKNATCEVEGVRTYICECGDTYTESIAVLGHSIGSWEVQTESTCTETGLKVKKCSRSGCSYQETEVIAATGHVYGEWIVVKGSTDLEEGLEERVCEACGVKEQKSIPKKDHKHSYSSAITKEATCTESGVRTYSCICNEDSYTETIDVLGHVLGNWTIETEATCLKDGMKVRTCSRSGCTYEEIEVLESSGHAYGGWKVIKEATDLETGLMERECVNCGNKEQKIIESGTHLHDYRLSFVIEATCECAGSKTYSCTCGESYSETIDALGHVMGQWRVQEEATCDMDGLKAKTCYREECDHAEYRIIEASGHEYGEWITLVEPTTEEEGVKEHTCANCGNKEYTNIDKLEEQPPVLNNPFKDVKETDYFYNSVLWAVDNQITSGMSSDMFAPNFGCTRAEVVTFLWRAAGRPEPQTSELTFKDVAENAYYTKAVLWAAEQGITSGYNDEVFGSNDQVTRCQFVTFLWRMEDKPEPVNAENEFSDIASNAYYYKAVLWAVENSITAGYYQDLFAPDMSCTRCQVVSFLYRAYK